MKHKLLRISTLALLSFASNAAYADKVYTCTSGNEERLITVNYDSPDSLTPCQVEYTKNGQSNVLWRAEGEEGYCEAKAEEFVLRQVKWGWQCNVDTK